MKLANSITKQKQPVELKKNSLTIKAATNNLQERLFKIAGYIFKNQRGGGLATLFIGLALILLAITIFINIVDYSIYTFERNNISKAMDYAVTAAVQQVNIASGRDGIASGFSEGTGEKSFEDVKIDMDLATKTFLSVFGENCNIDGLDINENLMICATYTHSNKLNYCIKTSQGIVSEGIVDAPSQVEERINQAIDQYWLNSDDISRVYINQNPKTNILENGTYLFTFIKDIEIKGINSQKYISLSSLAGAKMER